MANRVTDTTQNERLEAHERRLKDVEDSNHKVDKTLAVVLEKLDQVISDVGMLKDQWPKMMDRLESFITSFTSNFCTKGELSATGERLTKVETRVSEMEKWKNKVDPYGSTPNLLRWIGIIAAIVIVAWPIITAIIIKFVVN